MTPHEKTPREMRGVFHMSFLSARSAATSSGGDAAQTEQSKRTGSGQVLVVDVEVIDDEDEGSLPHSRDQKEVNFEC